MFKPGDKVKRTIYPDQPSYRFDVNVIYIVEEILPWNEMSLVGIPGKWDADRFALAEVKSKRNLPEWW